MSLRNNFKTNFFKLCIFRSKHNSNIFRRYLSLAYKLQKIFERLIYFDGYKHVQLLYKMFEFRNLLYIRFFNIRFLGRYKIHFYIELLIILTNAHPRNRRMRMHSVTLVSGKFYKRMARTPTDIDENNFSKLFDADVYICARFAQSRGTREEGGFPPTNFPPALCRPSHPVCMHRV